ncbi:hypothetical protein FIBSPDRAFT_492322 [Athelia psychrophila]|uniref:Uncharacterized protein n=1 Tax=Athelia psychrophila TaxID=1759441 RepID=A0A166KP81_9AGAM|nr:hypothetical protein FIBSPDRAFT_492322 [Fibularhizoctonia sp. CBS 109695]
MSLNDDREYAVESSIAGLAASTSSSPVLETLVPVSVMFTTNNTGGSSMVNNICGDQVINCLHCHCILEEENGGEAAAELRILQHRRRGLVIDQIECAESNTHPDEVQPRMRAWSGESKRGPDDSETPQKPAVAAAVSIQLHIDLVGQPCEAQIVITYRMVAASSCAFFFFQPFEVTGSVTTT